MTVLEVGIVIPDTYEELMTIWGEDGPNAILIVWAKTRWRSKEDVQRKDVRLPMSPGGTTSISDIWNVDRFTKQVGFRLEQPNGPWDQKEGEFSPRTNMCPGDTLHWTSYFYVVW